MIQINKAYAILNAKDRKEYDEFVIKLEKILANTTLSPDKKKEIASDYKQNCACQLACEELRRQEEILVAKNNKLIAQYRKEPNDAKAAVLLTQIQELKKQLKNNREKHKSYSKTYLETSPRIDEHDLLIEKNREKNQKQNLGINKK